MYVEDKHKKKFLLDPLIQPLDERKNFFIFAIFLRKHCKNGHMTSLIKETK